MWLWVRGLGGGWMEMACTYAGREGCLQPRRIFERQGKAGRVRQGRSQ